MPHSIIGVAPSADARSAGWSGGERTGPPSVQTG